MFKKIGDRRNSAVIVEQIINLLKENKLKPGDKLPSEPEMARMLGVGRSSIREAKQILAAKNIIEILPGKGSFVKKIGPEFLDSDIIHVLLAEETLLEIYEVREILEVQISGLAAQRATTENLQAMERAIEDMKRNAEIGLDVYDPGLDFHIALAEATQNKVLVKLYRPLFDLLLKFQKPIYVRYSDPLKELKAHREIYEAVCSQDPQRAMSLMIEHLEYVRNLTIENLPQGEERRE